MSFPVCPNASVCVHDTYGIGLRSRMSILKVSDRIKPRQYHPHMAKKAWESWGRRLREMAKDGGYTLASLGEKIHRAESTVRSWTNGTREINLSEFFELCEAAEADPSQVLFGAITMDPETQRQLGAIGQRVLAADPAASPTYGKMAKGLRKKVKL